MGRGKRAFRLGAGRGRGSPIRVRRMAAITDPCEMLGVEQTDERRAASRLTSTIEG